MTQKTLTKRQAEVYEFIVEFAALRGYQPSIREIAKGLEISSTNGVVCHLVALEKKNWIVRGAYQARSIKVLGRCPLCYAGERT